MASNQVSKSKIAVYAYLATDAFASSLRSSLDDRAYQLQTFSTHGDFVAAIEACRDEIDCLVLGAEEELSLLDDLRSRSVLLPTILIEDALPNSASLDLADDSDPPNNYRAVLCLELGQIDQLPARIDEVISQFLKIPAGKEAEETAWPDVDSQEQAQLANQQRRLAEKLKERLGYMGVYYKRDPSRFIRYMSSEDKEELIAQLKQSYQQIILNYFTDDPLLNQKIDNYVNSAFFADVPVVKIVEIHMDIMDAFSKQLKLEGRNEEILLDYRLTLIDALSNLCEMYRRSIPRQP